MTPWDIILRPNVRLATKAINIQYSLHGMRKQCACRDVVQIDQYDLRHEGDRKIRVDPHSWEISESQHSNESAPGNPKLITKADKQCPACGHKYAELLDLPFYSRYVPVAIVAVCGKHGTFLRSPSERDLARLKQADAQRGQLDFGPVEDFRVNNGPKSGDLLRHNVQSYLDTFSSRQLLYLNCAIQQLRNYTGINKLILGDSGIHFPGIQFDAVRLQRLVQTASPAQFATFSLYTLILFNTLPWRTTRSTRRGHRETCNNSFTTALNGGANGRRRRWKEGLTETAPGS